MIGALARGRATLLGILLGASYGGLARFLLASDRVVGLFAPMTFGFLFLVPLAIGYLAIRPLPAPSRAVALLGPWIPCTLAVAAAWLVGWEGAICIVFALPVLLLLSSFGGVIAASRAGRRPEVMPAVLALPWVVMPLEAGVSHPRRHVETVTEIRIGAPPSIVWPLVVSVDSIRPAERRPALFTAIGFPEPVAATLSHPGVGGVRTATFERGVVFHEAVVAWEPERRLRFTIDPVAVPPTALDPHVTIGGSYFDVLTGTYELFPLAGDSTRLVLRSEHRVSTAFNPYAGWWTDRVMASIQRNILAVLRARAERAGGPARAG